MMINSKLKYVITATALLLGGCAQSTTTEHLAPVASKSANKQLSVQIGAAQQENYLQMLEGKRVGMVVNQTSMVKDQHIVDVLLAEGVQVNKIFAPEHGFRGDHDAGAHVNSSVDAATGIDIVSIYGKNKKPSADVLEDVDVLIFDIQDVGVRYYTYISSMHYMMEAAAEQGKQFIVFDRPNPNGFSVDGPVLDLDFQSFVGMHQIPLLHGMTVGELAQMINGEGWLKNGVKADLTVIPVSHYDRHMSYPLPIKPSPNLPNDVSISLYASLGFFEGTPVSIGRGTDFPFQVIGFDKFNNGDFTFTPRPIKGASMKPKLKGKKAVGVDLRESSVLGLNIDHLIQWHKVFKEHDEEFFTRAKFFDKLAGTDTFRKQIESGMSGVEIRKSWQKDLSKFLQQRKPYLIYPN